MNTHKAKETSHVAQDDFRSFDRGRAERGDLGPDLRIAGGGGGGGWHSGGFHGGGFGFGVGTAIGLGILAGAAYDSSCMAQRVFNTPTGPVVRWVNVCY
jgi:hypothetical protein